jgi:type IV pilus assembly protein PilC
MISSAPYSLTALISVGRTAGNKVIQNAIDSTRKSISEGKSFAEPLTASGVFPPMVVQMIAVGESTGAWIPCSPKLLIFTMKSRRRGGSLTHYD